ncbi:glycosyltransferase [Pseudoduganella buxea]|uniref:Uncharacterized protein n=1 Tax=Pseudoduganella buxea TaxID=1949069 RepID=A0A6I3SVY7_9BURK|nr:glycosyltransferase [Pseudoduganella buxea]MTV53179.1 hypothetical protein [Pseudoduganella buxea]GGC00089.1 hypothetical protein GCM10011572_22560 [Pseudoduganella buxea]
MSFELEYDLLIGELKADFLACRQWELLCQDGPADPAHVERLRLQQQGWRHRLAALRRHVRDHFEWFDARRVSSLLGIPTRALAPDELLLHRIWMGGPVPDGVRQAVGQWGAALDELAAPPGRGYRSILWVWDAAQLAADPWFRPGADGARPFHLGGYCAGGDTIDVCSLAALVERHAPALAGRLAGLHAGRWFVNLSDYLRILLLRECGGIYLDADTMPYRAATVFLARPEVPDYVHFALVGGRVQASVVSWLNLVRDENGVLVARRGDAAVRELAAAMEGALAALPEVPLVPTAPSPAFARLLQEATYHQWRRHLGSTLLSYQEMVEAHGVLADGRAEPVVAGVRGMRLDFDGDTGAPLPLSPEERHWRERCVAALAQRGWRLGHPLALERLVELDWVSEVAPPAYAPQLRANPACCNYYSFLSTDGELDRVNTLFAAYLLARNDDAIARGGFWCRIRGALAGGAAWPAPRQRELPAHA